LLTAWLGSSACRRLSAYAPLKTIKKRPVMIISRHTYQQTRPDVILTAITSQIRQLLATGVATRQDWQAAVLAKPSVLKPLIATLE
jgi:mRNA interferase MazF